jgi:hypothetical protein
MLSSDIAHLGGGEPPGESAKVPLGADVRPWPQQHIQAQVLGELQVGLQIGNALPVVLLWKGLMDIPGDVNLHIMWIFPQLISTPAYPSMHDPSIC